MQTRDIIVIGGSAGAAAVLKTLVQGLPAEIPASLFVTIHLPMNAHSHLADMLRASCALPVVRAVDGQPIERGRVYVGVPDRHLLLIDGTIRLGLGPRENMMRPAIDPMFRSAALSYGSRAVGVVLTGMMSDGASGLHAIKSAGGTTIVQHPLDADADSMPRAALEATAADHVVRGDELADLLVEVCRAPSGPSIDPPEGLLFEVEVAAGAPLGSAALRRFAEPVALLCPDCEGVLSGMGGSRPLRFRCQIGHAHTADILASRNEKVDQAIRIAMRVMEERVELVDRMARDARACSRNAMAELYEQRREEYRRYATTLREAAVLNTRMHRLADEDPAG